MAGLLVRLLESKDLTQLPDLYADQQVYTNTLQLPYAAPDQWRDMLARPGHTSLVAVRGEDLLGHTGVDMLQRQRRRHVATFGIGVKAAARGQGVGTALVKAAVDLCDNWANITRIELQVYTDNDAAIALYQKFGFVIEGTHRHYAIRDGALVDAHFMARIKP
jgi:L-phenylalanine/L-methionine N-acetyltransferase